MRFFVLAAPVLCFSLVLAASEPAKAQEDAASPPTAQRSAAQDEAPEGLAAQWREAAGRLQFRHPADWPVNETRTSEPGAVRVYVGPANAECQIWSFPKPDTASESAEAVRARYQRPASDRFWTETVTPLNYFRGGAVQVGGRSLDTSGAWPIQRVSLSGGDRVVRGALQGRPGLEFLSLCLSFDGADRAAIFSAIEASIDGASAGP